MTKEARMTDEDPMERDSVAAGITEGYRMQEAGWKREDADRSASAPYHEQPYLIDSFWCYDPCGMEIPVNDLPAKESGKVTFGSLNNFCKSNLGLPELVAFSPDEYVAIASTLAHDPPRLEELRRTLRARMEASVLMDAPRFTRNIETAYRAMWQRWVAGGKAAERLIV